MDSPQGGLTITRLNPTRFSWMILRARYVSYTVFDTIEKGAIRNAVVVEVFTTDGFGFGVFVYCHVARVNAVKTLAINGD